MTYTIKDVARMAGVSVATVSMALNNRPGVKQETRERVSEIAAQMGYTPNENARSLIKRRSNTVGLVVTDLTNPFFAMLAGELSACLAERGYELSLGISGDSVEREAACVKRFMRERVEGVVIVPTIQADYDLQHLFELKASGIPAVFSTTCYDGVDMDCVMCDLAQGSYMLTSHLIKSGHRRIFLIAGDRRAVFSRQRIKGYTQAFADAGMAHSEDWIVQTEPYYKAGYEAMAAMLPQRPDAVTTVNDQLAMGVLKCLKDRGVAVPGDISVAGYDDLLYSSMLETPLTTVRQPVSELAEETAELLTCRIQSGGDKTQLRLIKPILKIRDTTK